MVGAHVVRPYLHRIVFPMKQSILITGASGKTGKAVISALALNGYKVTAFTHKKEYTQELLSIGANDVRIGDLRSNDDLSRALTGMDAIYHICPNMTPDEAVIGRNIIRLCEDNSVGRFVYHSVLHPQIRQMPHHWQKMEVEEEIFRSKLEYTVLQPTVYYQNMMGYLPSILKGIYPMPYSSGAKISLVDLRDVAMAAVKVFDNGSTIHGIYELVGSIPFSQVEIAEKLSETLRTTVKAVEVKKEDWEVIARNANMSEYTRETLLSMFHYYDRFGLKGSPLALTYILGRKPITIEQYLEDDFIGYADK